MAGQDAEVAADVGDDGADRLAADFCGDLLRGGQVCDAGVGFVSGGRGGLPGCARRPWGRSTSGRRVQAVGVAEEPRFERVGAVQAAGDAREDQRDIAVPKQEMTGPGSVKARWRIVAASSLP